MEAPSLANRAVSVSKTRKVLALGLVRFRPMPLSTAFDQFCDTSDSKNDRTRVHS